MKEVTRDCMLLLVTMAGAGLTTCGVVDAFRDLKETEKRGKNTTNQTIWCVVSSGCLALNLAAVTCAFQKL